MDVSVKSKTRHEVVLMDFIFVLKHSILLVCTDIFVKYFYAFYERFENLVYFLETLLMFKELQKGVIDK